MPSAGGPLGTRRLGQLRNRVRLESPVRTAGATGQSDVTGWTDQGTFWASVEETVGNDDTRHNQQVPEHTHEVLMRGGPAILHDWRIVWNSRILNVVAVTGSGSSLANGLMVLCKETPASTP